VDDDFVRRFNDVKLEKKKQLAALVAKRVGVEIPPPSYSTCM
jgi:hypothetical protein